MTSDRDKPRYDAGRRIRRLGVAIIIAVMAYSAGWYWLAGQVGVQADRLVSAQRGQGTEIDCADRDVGGYPFRFAISCSSIAVARAADGLAIDGGGFRSDALIYNPRRIEAVIDAPVTVDSAVAGPLRLDWSRARAIATVAQPLPEKGSAAVDDLVVGLPGLDRALAAEHAEAFMRTVGADLDLALRYEGLVLDSGLTAGRDLPVLAGDADIGVTDGVALAAGGARSLRGVEGTIRRLALLLTPTRGLLVNGPVSVGQDGLVAAKLQLTIVDPAGFAAAMKPVFPEYASQIDLAAAGQAEAGPDGTPEITIPVTIRDGRVMLGFIPVGQIPPLD